MCFNMLGTNNDIVERISKILGLVTSEHPENDDPNLMNEFKELVPLVQPIKITEILAKITDLKKNKRSIFG